MIQMSSKEVLRKKFKKKRSELSRKDVLFRSELINSKISDEEEFKKAKKIGCFYPIKNEPIINLPTDKLIYFPKISNEKLTYHLSTKKTLNNSYGIKEPDDDNPVELNHIDLILVPLLVFNENLYRIGKREGIF